MATRRLFTAAVLFLTVAVASAVKAGAQTQTVTFAVNSVNQISFSGTPSLTVNTATAGSDPIPATDATSSWNVTTNQSGAKISASIATAMPAGLTLNVNLAAPAGATSAGLTALGTGAVDLVTGIAKQKGTTLSVTYELDATVVAGVVSGTKIVTYTISGGT
jgi:hypothetical protein